MVSISIVGSLNIDFVTTTPRVPGPGETLTATSFDTGFGGKGANQAVACARLTRRRDGSSDSSTKNVTLYMHGAAGDDKFGDDFCTQLSKEGLDTAGVKRHEKISTGSACILVEEKSGENRIMVTPGANGRFRTSTDVSLVDGPGLVVFQLELPQEEVFEAIKLSKESGKEIVFNPAPAVPIPDHVLANVDHLVVNESEAAILSNYPEETLMDNLESVADLFLSKGVKVVVITLGGHGSYWKATGAGTGAHVPSRTGVKVVDTTAAGDTFLGAYTVRRAQGLVNNETGYQTTKDATLFANKVASLAVEKAGAQSSIPYRDEVPADWF